ncbi:hypothetical protein PC39_10377 [Salinisphaera sp. PC39]|uniref:DUF411 domain-containing protein n=1 Tax=Salinisphaera sp. PC39 TaxID=1304156 RepID=UPI00333E56AB
MSRASTKTARHLVQLTLALVIGLASMQPLSAAPPVTAALYKNPDCQCCDAYAAYLRRHGLEVTVIATSDLIAVKREHGVPRQLAACHTMTIDEYVVEGHVPIGVIEKLLRERPAIQGVSLPGMPPGSPGMTGEKQQPFVIYAIDKGEPRVYTTH